MTTEKTVMYIGITMNRPIIIAASLQRTCIKELVKDIIVTKRIVPIAVAKTRSDRILFKMGNFFENFFLIITHNTEQYLKLSHPACHYGPEPL